MWQARLKDQYVAFVSWNTVRKGATRSSLIIQPLLYFPTHRRLHTPETTDVCLTSPACTHRFHRDCLLDWLERRNNVECPVCRTMMVSNDQVWEVVERRRAENRKARLRKGALICPAKLCFCLRRRNSGTGAEAAPTNDIEMGEQETEAGIPNYHGSGFIVAGTELNYVAGDEVVVNDIEATAPTFLGNGQSFMIETDDNSSDQVTNDIAVHPDGDSSEVVVNGTSSHDAIVGTSATNTTQNFEAHSEVMIALNDEAVTDECATNKNPRDSSDTIAVTAGRNDTANAFPANDATVVPRDACIYFSEMEADDIRNQAHCPENIEEESEINHRLDEALGGAKIPTTIDATPEARSPIKLSQDVMKTEIHAEEQDVWSIIGKNEQCDDDNNL